MAGTLTISTLSDGTNSTSATNPIKGSAKAWVNYNPVGQSIRGSFNVSSVTYVTTGRCTVNFTTAMPNANYSALASGAGTNIYGNQFIVSLTAGQTFSTSSIQISSGNSVNNASVDGDYICVSIFS
jgi:hypothetical protein